MKTTTINMQSLMISGCYAVMEDQVVESTKFSGQTISGARLTENTFHNCTFSNCVFYGSWILNCKFVACKFENCRFEFTKIENTKFISTSFENCELKKGGQYGNDFSICQFDTNFSDSLDFDNNDVNNCFMDEKTITKINLLLHFAAA
jgi:uncharacterized protein YjbI with pentapeptide repeats